MQHFAQADPQTILSSGNGLAILALIIVVLAGVIVYQSRKMDKQEERSSGEIKALNAQLLADYKTNSMNYLDVVKTNQEVLLGVKQSSELLSEKIEAVKAGK